MPGIHSDSEMPGVAFRRGSEGDARQGTCYGHRDDKTYNRIKIRATEQDEGRPVVLLHYAQVTNDNRIVRFFVINGHLDPGMKVFSRVPTTCAPAILTGDSAKGTIQLLTPNIMEEWVRTEQDGRYIFHAPDSYKEGGLTWMHRADLGDESLVYEQVKNFLFLNDG